MRLRLCRGPGRLQFTDATHDAHAHRNRWHSVEYAVEFSTGDEAYELGLDRAA